MTRALAVSWVELWPDRPVWKIGPLSFSGRFRTENIQGKAGEYLWFGEVWEHLSENLSDDSAELIYVEVKK